jgi:hypothetical protein
MAWAGRTAVMVVVVRVEVGDGVFTLVWTVRGGRFVACSPCGGPPEGEVRPVDRQPGSEVRAYGP